MLDRLLGKKEKGIQVFNIPEKKYCHDSKKISKMDKKDLIDVMADMEKHIGSLCEKLDLGKKQYQLLQEKCDQAIQKSNVVNAEIARINNEHEQLQVKLMNFQSSLEMMTQERQLTMQVQIKYIEERGLSKEKIKDLSKVFEVYHSQISITDKIQQQNKQLKQKLADSQSEYHQLSQKYNELKTNNTIKDQHFEKQQTETKGTNQDQTQKQNEYSHNCVQCQNLQSAIEGKDQIITSLNKQITAQRSKLAENSSCIEQLNSDLEQILKKVELKDEQLSRYKTQNTQLSAIISNYKRVQAKQKSHEDRQKQEIQDLRKNYNLIEKQYVTLKQKSQPLQREHENLSKQIQQLKLELERKQMTMENTNQKLRSYQQQIENLSKLSSEIKSKQHQVHNIKEQVEKEKRKNEDLDKSMKAMQQDYQLKMKKLEVSFNQERIKTDGLKRSLQNFETKDQENKKNLDEMYESRIQQDGKIVQMEKKLKEYKHMIQYLRKEKVELEKTFQNKLKNMEELVINEEEQVEEPLSGLKVSKDISGQLSPSPRVDLNLQEIKQDLEKQSIKWQKRIAELEEQVDMLKQQNMNIRLQKQKVSEMNNQLQSSLKSLTSKREQMMREIKKMSSLKSIDPQDKQNQKQPVNIEENKSKEKKIAQKAYKGFDILAKLMSGLYKQFVSFHVSSINKKEIKDMESTINQIVRKSLDMKDIFQDYI